MHLSMKEKIVARRVLRALRTMVSERSAEAIAVIERAAREWEIDLEAPSIEKPVRGRSTGAQILNNRTRPARRN